MLLVSEIGKLIAKCTCHNKLTSALEVVDQ